MMTHPIVFFLHLQNTVKLYHWMTTSYARHKAADTLYEELVDLGDKFIETFIGKYERPKNLGKKELSFTLTNYTDTSITSLLDFAERYLTHDIMKYISEEKDQDLINIRDDILTTISQTRYLFTLK